VNNTKRRQNYKKGVIRLFILAPLTVFTLFPFVWMILTSLKPKREIMMFPPVLFPSKIVFNHYIDLYKGGVFLKALTNSIVVVLVTVVAIIVIAFMAAYGLARFKVKRKRIFLVGILFSQILPSSVRFMPLFIVMATLGLLNTFTSVWIGYMGWLLPFGVFMLFGYLQKIPLELEEAAIIDGASRFKTLIHIVIPLSAPGIAAVAIFCFLSAWNEFMLANVFLVNTSNWTLPVALVSMIGYLEIDWGQLMAGSVVTIIPVALGLVIFQKFLVSGLTKGAIKE